MHMDHQYYREFQNFIGGKWDPYLFRFLDPIGSLYLFLFVSLFVPDFLNFASCQFHPLDGIMNKHQKEKGQHVRTNGSSKERKKSGLELTVPARIHAVAGPLN